MDKGYTGKRTGDASIGILLAFQVFEPEFGPKTHVKKPCILVCTYNPRPRKVEPGNPWGSPVRSLAYLASSRPYATVFF